MSAEHKGQTFAGNGDRGVTYKDFFNSSHVLSTPYIQWCRSTLIARGGGGGALRITASSPSSLYHYLKLVITIVAKN